MSRVESSGQKAALKIFAGAEQISPAAEVLKPGPVPATPRTPKRRVRNTQQP